MPRIRDEAGFTLLELTAAMLVTSLIVLAVASSLAAVTDGWDRGERRVADREAVRVLSRRLGRELAALAWSPLGTGVSLSGDREGFTFTAAGKDGPERLVLGVREGWLILMVESLRSPEKPVEIRLVEDVERLEIEYYDARTKTWRDQWPADASRPPALIRLLVKLAGGRPRPSPALVLPIYAGRVYGPGEVEPDE